jgi:hypothetical protein
MIEVRMRQKYVTNRSQVLERQITDTGAGIDEHVIVDQHRRRTRPGTNSAAATKDSYAHRFDIRHVG